MRNGPPSSPRLWRRISAPVSWWTSVALGERGGRLLEVDAIDLDPAVARPHEGPGLLGEAGDVGGRELDVVEQHRPGHVAQLVGADDGVRRLGEQPEHRRRLAARHAPAPGRRTRPRRASGRSSSSAPRPGPGSAPAGRVGCRSSSRGRGTARPRRSHSGASGEPPLDLAQRGVDRQPLAPAAGARTDTSQTPASPGGSSCTVRIGRDVDVTPRVQRSSAWATSSTSRRGPWNDEPSMRAITVSTHVARRAGRRRGRRQLHPLDALGDDGLDHGGQHGRRRRPAALPADHGDGARHRRRQRGHRRARPAGPVATSPRP